MAIINSDVGAPYVPPAAHLAVAQTFAGAAISTNIIDRGGRTGPALLTVTTTIGATPTCTYAIEGSADGVDWFPVAYADAATPETVSVATFVITTATTVRKILRPGHPWRFLRVNMTANTNVTSTIDIWIF